MNSFSADRLEKNVKDIRKLLGFITDTLTGGKAEDIVTVKMDSKHSLIDYMIIASASSNRQLNILAQLLQQGLKNLLKHPILVEGAAGCDWILLDAGDVVIHLFKPEVREFYKLEKLWASG